MVCGAEAADAHHIVERRLWRDGGYYLENGAALCAEHHCAAEQTTLSCEEIRSAAGIQKVLLPSHCEQSEEYDKWLNPILADGRRGRGPLFGEESVRKALAAGGALDLFTPYVKAPRTPHLPWSPGASDDDMRISDLAGLEGQLVVVTEKLDGESSSIYRDHVHARSLDSGYHPTRTMVSALAGRIGHELPDGWRVCGENLQGRHSIAYADAASFYCFGIWDETNTCLSWDATCEWAELLGIETVPELYRGVFDRSTIEAAWDPAGPSWASVSEGYVVRRADGFAYSEFGRSVAKYVRANHVQTAGHWLTGNYSFNQVRAS